MVFNATFNNISVIYKGNWVEMFVKCYGIKLCADQKSTIWPSTKFMFMSSRKR
jgi:hypothetical protein